MLSGGRAFFGIGTGATSTDDIGRGTRLAEFEAYVKTVRGLVAGETVVYRGHEHRMLWDGDRAPVWVAGNGPKTLQMAGRVGDGVIVGNGATPELVKYALSQIA